MHLLVLSLDHAHAPLSLRERVHFGPAQLGGALAELGRRLSPLVLERAILSTCHRTEIYCTAAEAELARAALVQWLARERNIPLARLDAHAQALEGAAAVRHAFRVASGLESLVPGEPHVLGQMKDAARRAQEAGSLGPVLHHLFQRAFATAKDVRTRTGIGTASISMAAAALRLAQRTFPDLGETRVLFVGAGTMIGRVAEHFAAQKPRAMVVANRTPEGAQRLAERLGGRAIALEQVAAALPATDILVSCTASDLPVVRHADVREARLGRAHRPMLIVDLAVPRDVESRVARLPNVAVYTVDHLRDIVRSGEAARRGAFGVATGLIEPEVHAFVAWMAARRAVPLLRRLADGAAGIREAEVRRAERLLARGAPAPSVLATLAARLSNKLLHAPRVALARGELAPELAERLVAGLPGRAS